MMKKQTKTKRSWIDIPPWIILGAVLILVPIFVFWTLENIHKQKEDTTLLLLEKGAALIRSFEAGTRTGMMGMMGMHGTGFELQNLLTETAQAPDIVYLVVTDVRGTVLAHSDLDKIGGTYGTGLDLERISRSDRVAWRQVSTPNGADVFEVYRRFSPARQHVQGYHWRGMAADRPGLHTAPQDAMGDGAQIIFVGLDMGPVERARKEDVRHTVIMAVILLLIGFAGMVSLFLAQAYRSTRSSLTRIKAFSDTVVENLPVGLLAVDAYGNIASLNQSAQSILRLSARPLLGRNAGEVLPQQLWALAHEAGHEKGIIETEIECPVGDEKTIPMEVSVSSLVGENADSLGYVFLFRDLTEIQDLKREVERSQRLASLGRLAAGIAHEIRNPLSSIKGFATYFMERYREIPEDWKTAQIMVQEVERLNRVIGQLLEFARPMAIQKQSASVQALIQDSLKMVEREAQKRNIKIDTDISPEVKAVSMDPDKIKQVLLNLYLNAMEAMADGGILSVCLSREEAARRIKIAVSDTGTGICKQDLAHIFDPYFTTKQSGTGLGLAIVHRIIETHGGEIKAETEPGKGTTVFVLLPLS